MTVAVFLVFAAPAVARLRCPAAAGALRRGRGVRDTQSRGRRVEGDGERAAEGVLQAGEMNCTKDPPLVLLWLLLLLLFFVGGVAVAVAVPASGTDPAADGDGGGDSATGAVLTLVFPLSSAEPLSHEGVCKVQTF